MDRDTLKTTAEQQAARGRFRDAIATYNTLVEEYPSDAAVWLRLGDLNTQVSDFVAAVQAYDNVGRYYKQQGFPLKAIAVLRRTREVVLSSVPHELPNYLHLAVDAAECCIQLGFTGDAFTAYGDAARDFANAGQDERAFEMWTRMSALDPESPLPHVHSAEHCLRRGKEDTAAEQYRRAVELLLSANKSLEATKVIERLLSFRKDASVARLAAEIHLGQDDRTHALKAIRHLQIGHEVEPRNLDTMALLVRAFTMLGQEEKALEVRKEMARVALADGLKDRFDSAIAVLRRLVPDDPDIKELEQAANGQKRQVSTDFIDGVFEEDKEATAPLPSRSGAGAPSARSGGPASDRGLSATPSSSALRRKDGSVQQRERLLSDIDDLLDQHRYHAAVHPLRDAITKDPNSLLLREKLRDLYQSMNYQEGVHNETAALAAIHAQNGNYKHARTLVDRVLSEDPVNATALQLKRQLERVMARAAAKQARAK